QMMNGDLTVESVLGNGSVFTVNLPVEVQEPAVEPVVPAPTPSTVAPAEAPILLVIDDDPAVRDLVQRSLSKEGFRVETAANGPQGLELARQLRPAAITLDVMMAGMDGWAVLSALKADKDLADIPVIMMTIMDDQHLGFALGAAEYLT